MQNKLVQNIQSLINIVNDENSDKQLRENALSIYAFIHYELSKLNGLSDDVDSFEFTDEMFENNTDLKHYLITMFIGDKDRFWFKYEGQVILAARYGVTDDVVREKWKALDAEQQQAFLRKIMGK